MSHKQRIRTGQNVYEYPVVQFRLRTDQQPVAAAIEEMDRLGLTPGQYIRWLLAIRFNRHPGDVQK